MSMWEILWSWWVFRTTLGVFIALLTLLAFDIATDWVRLAAKVDAAVLSFAGVYAYRVLRPSLDAKRSAQSRERLRAAYFRSMWPGFALVGGLFVLVAILLLR